MFLMIHVELRRPLLALAAFALLVGLLLLALA